MYVLCLQFSPRRRKPQFFHSQPPAFPSSAIVGLCHFPSKVVFLSTRLSVQCQCTPKRLRHLCGQDWVWSHLMGKLSWNSVESSFSVDSSEERYMWVIIHSWWVKQLMQFPDSVDNNVSLSPLLLMVGPPLLLVC